MKEWLRATIASLAILLALSPVVYIGGEGAFYLTTDAFWFHQDTAYRRIYAPLDAASERVPALYTARQRLAEGWLRLAGQSDRSVFVHPSNPFRC